MCNTTDQAQGSSHGDYTPTPRLGPGARGGVSLLRAPAWVLKELHRRDLKEKKGREEARPDSPSLPLPVLCKHKVFAICLAGGKTSLCSPGLDMRRGRDCTLAFGTLSSVPIPPTVPSGVSPGATGCRGTSCSGDGHVASHRSLLSSLLAHLGGGARTRTHTHTHTHQTNPESGLLSERINYWLMNIQIRNSAEPGGGLALGAALGRRIPPERYKSPLPLRRFPSGERSLLGKAEPRFPFFFFFFPLPLLHFQSARGPRNYNGLL